jgi:exonuclease III
MSHDSEGRTSNKNDNKRQKRSHDNEQDFEGDTYRQASENFCHPHSFVTWNVNGLTSRSRWNMEDLRRLLAETKHPDVICMQEVRLKAAGPGHQRGKPMDSEYRGCVEDVLRTSFGDYHPFWSLADTKYAGTLTLIHRRCFDDPNMMLSTKLSEISSFAAFTPHTAIDLMLRRLGKTRKECGLSISSTNGTGNKKTTAQTSMTSFFAPKSKQPTTLTPTHHVEGRFQFFFFPHMDVLQVYVPNNGTREESFQKRRNWDQDLLQFWRDRHRILSHCGQTNRKIVWCGDMNVARDYRDGSHWEKKEGGHIYEWWTDESKCFAQGDIKNPTRNKRPEDVGIPSFTLAERTRFDIMLQEGDFCDVWRELHPSGVEEGIEMKSPWQLPNYTWRGHLAKTQGSVAKYQGKGQRLDYFLLSPSNLLTTVESCEILGYGERKEGLFCGSDHCVVQLTLAKQDHGARVIVEK